LAQSQKTKSVNSTKTRSSTLNSKINNVAALSMFLKETHLELCVVCFAQIHAFVLMVCPALISTDLEKISPQLGIRFQFAELWQ